MASSSPPKTPHSNDTDREIPLTSPIQQNVIPTSPAGGKFKT